MKEKQTTLASSLASAAGKAIPSDHSKQSLIPPKGETVLIAAHYNREVRRALKMIEAETDKTLRELLGEAINDLCEKYGKPRPVADDGAH